MGRSDAEYLAMMASRKKLRQLNRNHAEIRSRLKRRKVENTEAGRMKLGISEFKIKMQAKDYARKLKYAGF